jgi:RNA polymerase sigma factor (sigma-70 family)
MTSAGTQSVVFNEYAKSCIRVKARQLSRRSKFGRSDVEDIEQSLWQVLFKEANRFDPRRASLNTFIDRVVQTAAGMIVRNMHRQKRAADKHAVSLDQPMPDITGDATSRLSQFISSDDQSRRTGTASDSGTDRYENADAVTHALNAMPDDVRVICRRLMGGSSISSAARNLGISRHRVREAIRAAQPLFEQAGFHN